MSVDALTRTFEAELRAVEEGHHAVVVDPDDPRVYRVVSDTRPHEWRYTVRVEVGFLAHGAIQAPTFECDHLTVQQIRYKQTRSEAPGLTACKHAALVARRLERVGLIVWAERHGWVQAAGVSLLTALRPPPRRTVHDDDPFAGL